MALGKSRTKESIVAKKDDDRLELRLTNKLGNIGLRAPCRLQIEVYDGTVTLKGMVQYEYQKKAAITAARSMEGVHGVIDQLKVTPPVRSWQEDEGAQEAHVPPEADPERPR
jgi:osmotically-inducible protein OsmY